MDGREKPGHDQKNERWRKVIGSDRWYDMRLGCPPNQSVALSQVHETVSWMMLICLEDHATARAGMAHRAPATAAQRRKFHSAISRHYRV
jgi:hypothetical protein